MGVREALGGRWATHPLVWLLMLPAATMLVVLQELDPDAPIPSWVLLSAVAQHLVDGAIVLGGGALLRQGRAVIPLPTIAGLWFAAALGRSITGASVAVALGGRDPELLFRVVSWSFTSAAWVPVTVYSIAVIVRRRETLGELDGIEQRLRALRERELRTSETTRAYLVSSLGETVVPVLEDLQSTLTTARHGMTGAAAAEMSLRISQVHDRVLTVVDAVGTVPHDDEAATLRPPSLGRTIDLRPDRTWSTALLIGFSTLALLLPPGLMAYGAPSALELLVATAAAVLVLGAVPSVLDRWPIPGASAQAATLIGGILSVAIALIVMLTSGIDAITARGLQLAPLLAFSLGGGNVLFRAAIAVASANDAAETLRGYRTRELEALEERYRTIVAQERERLTQIMHGPVQGRLAACVMALNFHAGPDAEPAAVAAIAEQVLEHLSAAADDLGMLIARPASSSSSS